MRANQGPRNVDSATEQTPLLRGDTPQQAPFGTAGTQESEVPLAEKPSTKELILVLSSIWLGVFLAALGMGYNTRLLVQVLGECAC